MSGAGFQLGPLLIEGLAVWSTGNKARNNTLDTVSYFQPLDTDTGYQGDWGTQLTALGLNYLNAMNEAGTRMAYSGASIGWDKYGRRPQLGLKATYAVTPGLTSWLVPMGTGPTRRSIGTARRLSVPVSFLSSRARGRGMGAGISARSS